MLETESLPLSIYVTCFQHSVALFGVMEKWNPLILENTEFLMLINHYYLEDIIILAIEQNSQGLILNLSLLHCGQILLLFSFFGINSI